MVRDIVDGFTYVLSIGGKEYRANGEDACRKLCQQWASSVHDVRIRIAFPEHWSDDSFCDYGIHPDSGEAV